MDIFTRTTPSMTIKPCAKSHRKKGSIIHGCCHSLWCPMPYNDSPHRQTKVPTAIKAARIIDQSSRPTKRSMHVRTYSRRATTMSAANANAPVMPRIDATLLSSRYSWLGFSTLSNCRENNAGMLSVIWLRRKARASAQQLPAFNVVCYLGHLHNEERSWYQATWRIE